MKNATRTNWNQLISNLNKLSGEEGKENKFYVKNAAEHGVNRVFLTKTFDLFVVRSDEGDFEHNKFLTEKEFKDIYGADRVKEYRAQRREFLEYLGLGKTYISGTQEDVLKIRDLIDETRALETGEREIGKYDKHTYGETREWTSDEWGMFNEFKKHMSSDEAIELTFAVMNQEEEIIQYYKDFGNNKVTELIDIKSPLYIIEGNIDKDEYKGIKI